VQQMKKRNKHKKRKILYVLVAAFTLFFCWNFFFEKPLHRSTQTNATSSNSSLEETKENTGPIKVFSGKEFRDLYEGFAYPNTALISEETSITGSPAADKRIRELAVRRGYKSRSAPVSNTLRNVGEGMYLQQLATEPWLEMKKAAAKDGVNLSLSAAYRSAADQKQIFLSRLGGIPLAKIASNEADTQINELLRTTAVPGYSRHHTGYTIDISCLSDPSVTFENSVCFRWLSGNNYENAKNFGWIPSYPDGGGLQGPDPESWEYVWVGVDPLRE